MSIKQSNYKIKTLTGEDVYHFTTSDKQVQILDKNLSLVGTLKEFAFEGKVVTGGAFTNLKVTGLYKVKSLTGLPKGFDVDKTAILSIKSVGEINNPDFTTYTLISQEGSIYSNTVVGAKQSGWSEGGTTLKNTINGILASQGDMSALETKTKSNLVGALNEVNTGLADTTKKFDNLVTDYDTFKKHNHDSVYLKKNGDIMNGELIFANGKGMQIMDSQSRKKDLMKVDAAGNVAFGHADGKLELSSKGGLAHNGKKVWTEVNHGKDSGLDADLLGGVNHSNYARRDMQNDFFKPVLLKEGNSLYLDETDSQAYGKIYWRNKDYFARGMIEFDASGRLNIFNNGYRFLTIKGDGRVEVFNGHDIYASEHEANLIFRLNGGDNGMGFYRNKSSKYFGMYDWASGGGRVFYVQPGERVMRFDNEIAIKGRKLYLQGATPSGARTVGDIWIA